MHLAATHIFGCLTICGNIIADHVGIRESYAAILRDRSHSQVNIQASLGMGPVKYRINESMGFLFSPVTIILLQRITTKTSLDQFCIHFIQICRLL